MTPEGKALGSAFATMGGIFGGAAVLVLSIALAAFWIRSDNGTEQTVAVVLFWFWGIIGALVVLACLAIATATFYDGALSAQKRKAEHARSDVRP